ncbi:MAG: carboxypeptidase-like regulatory domain-containing protein [Gemmatimonadetes bacterium]|nr:carboxypeptidase-like regulatory domain-containing protein [Gemmatimonadota bacterium]
MAASDPDRPQITGIVRSEVGTPLPHAQVAVTTTGRGTLTDGEGRFTVRDLSPGVHRLSVSMIGYAPQTREVRISPGAGSVQVEFTLAPTPLSLPGIQVTATPTGRDPLAVAQATTAFSGRALERTWAARWRRRSRRRRGSRCGTTVPPRRSR